MLSSSKHSINCHSSARPENPDINSNDNIIQTIMGHASLLVGASANLTFKQ